MSQTLQRCPLLFGRFLSLRHATSAMAEQQRHPSIADRSTRPIGLLLHGFLCLNPISEHGRILPDELFKISPPAAPFALPSSSPAPVAPCKLVVQATHADRTKAMPGLQLLHSMLANTSQPHSPSIDMSKFPLRMVSCPESNPLGKKRKPLGSP